MTTVSDSNVMVIDKLPESCTKVKRHIWWAFGNLNQIGKSPSGHFVFVWQQTMTPANDGIINDFRILI